MSEKEYALKKKLVQETLLNFKEGVLCSFYILWNKRGKMRQSGIRQWYKGKYREVDRTKKVQIERMNALK